MPEITLWRLLYIDYALLQNGSPFTDEGLHNPTVSTSTEPCHIMPAQPEALHKIAAMSEPSAKLGATPEHSAKTAAMPESPDYAALTIMATAILCVGAAHEHNP